MDNGKEMIDEERLVKAANLNAKQIADFICKQANPREQIEAILPDFFENMDDSAFASSHENSTQNSPSLNDHGNATNNHGRNSNAFRQYIWAHLQQVYNKQERKRIKKEKQCPFRDFTCEFCDENHWTQTCPKLAGRLPITPYMGDKISKGWFHCWNCGNGWKSENTLAKEAQECYECKAIVFPHRMKPL